MLADQEPKNTIIIGGGQAGLAVSYFLSQQDRKHIILEKNQRIAESWRSRWDSFTLVTPNWQLQMPGYPYQGDNPDGFLTRDEVVRYLEEYVEMLDPPLRFGVEVTAVERLEKEDGYVVRTTTGAYRAQNVVVAVGTFQQPDIPDFSGNISDGIHQLHSSQYRNPGALPDGGVMVVGSGQSGSQLAQELYQSGRQVHLCTGSAWPLPRRYRGKDSMWWLDQTGVTRQPVDELEDPAERFAANPQVSGKDGGQDINLHAFARDGVRLLGHLEDARGTRVKLAPDLHQNLARGDKRASEVMAGIDKFIRKTGMDAPRDEVPELEHGYEQNVITELDLEKKGIGTILWATGFEWDYSWVRPASLDEFGYPVQQRGVTDSPGLYFMGLHWMHTLKSALFLGLGEDAEYIADHMKEHR